MTPPGKRTHMNANTSLRMNPELVYNRLESWTVYRSLRVTRRKIQYVKVPMAIPAKAPTRTSPRKCTPKYVLINELAAAGDAYYRYDANKKQLYLSRWAPFMMKVPGGRIGMYTILDALRGANINNLQADFGSNEIYIRLNFEKEKTISGLIKTIEQSPNLLLFDVQVYRIDATSNPLDWQEIVKDYGITRIDSSVSGIMGRILSIAPQKVRQTFLETLRNYAPVNLVSEGVVVMPNGWKVRFDIGQCAKIEGPEQKLSMLFQSNILSDGKAESNIALDTPTGEITSFHTIYNMNNTLNIIAVKGKSVNPEWDDNIEYIITLQPKLVRLVK